MKSTRLALPWLSLLCLLLGALSVNAYEPSVLARVKPDNQSALASPTFEEPLCRTNAECLKRGLPVLKPTRRRLVARAGPSAKPVTGAVVMYPAGSGPNPVRRSFRSKRELVTRAGDAPTRSLGYLSMVYESNSLFYTATQDYASALQITFDSTISGSQNLVTNHAGSKPYFCAIRGQGNLDTMPLALTDSSYNYSFLTSCTNPGTPYTAADRTASPADGLDDDTETEGAIFQIDISTGKLTILWTNPENTSPESIVPTIGYDVDSPWLYLTGNNDMWKQRFGGNGAPVDFYVMTPPA